MIKLEIFEPDGRRVMATEWRDSEARQMGAYRMRWLGSGKRPGLWARTTDRYGKVTTQGQVPEGQEAERGRYVIHAWREDGDYLDAEPFHVMPASTSASKAEDYRLDHRMGGNSELVITWETETQLNARAARKDAAKAARLAEEIKARWLAENPEPHAHPEHKVGDAVVIPAGLGTVTGHDGTSVLVTAGGFEYSVSPDRITTVTVAEPEADPGPVTADLTPAEAITPEVLAMYGATVTDPGVHDVMIVNFPSVRDAASWVGASGLDARTCQLRDMDGWGPCTVQVTGVHSTAKAEPKPAPAVDEMITALDAAPDLSDGIDPRTWREVYDAGLVDATDVTRAYRNLEDAWHRDEAGEAWNPTDPGYLDPAELAEDQALRVVFNSKARHYQAEKRGELVAFAKWSGELLKVYLPGGTFIGIMYRSDGKIIAGETVYTYRAYAARDPLQVHKNSREVARGASLADAFQALLTARAEQH